MVQQISEERINQFLSGRDPMMGIISMECGYQDDEVSIIYKHPTAGKKLKKVDFEPFAWAKVEGARKLYIDPQTGKQDQILLKKKMSQYGIVAKGLAIHSEDGFTTERLENGYRVLFEAKNKMSFNKFIQFFKQGGCDLWGQDKLFLSVAPVEQYMMKSGKRMFKGFEDYDHLTRLEFDLETTGLNPQECSIEQIGIRTNKGFEKILTIEGRDEDEKRDNELRAIDQLFQIIKHLQPDVISGHNSENFDWDFIIVRCMMLGTDIKEMSEKYFHQPIYKKKRKTVLKLGGEVEYFNQTIIWGHNVTDSLHAIRRAQAIDSNMKKASLKYVAEYSKLKKPNRVYVEGKDISKIWNDREDYAFNNLNGDYYKISDSNPISDNYEVVDGRYIVERYLQDDLYETDKIELRYNQSNFLLGKILPTTFTKVCTMGTAGTWKLIMMAWSYENNLAIPDFAQAGKFTGGLSRLLQVGYVPNVVKLDYNSLYPAITLTWDIRPDLDVSYVMMSLLGYILDKREEYKELKNEAKAKGKKLKSHLEELIQLAIQDNIDRINEEIRNCDHDETSNDKKQLPFKIFGNSFFGSFGAPNLFPWGDLKSAEKITCIGRQSLRLMVYWFKKREYQPVVGDTDGFNYSMPPKEELEKRTYIGKGLSRSTIDGKKYDGVKADVAEFSDLYMRGKMGLGIDEFATATINFSRKNYCDLLDDGEVKLVGNSIKSKRMPLYIENFLASGIVHLLNNDGKSFLSNYYDYIERIYNYDIPLIEIASKGKIKKTIKEYKINCKGTNKNGAANSRQAWYELCIQHDIEPQMGETIYYINIGTKKGEGDVKREKIYKTDVEGKFVYQDSKDKDGNLLLTKTGKQKREKIEIGEEIKLNCIMVPQELIESNANLSDLIGTDLYDVEYNVPKYIDQFNNRIKPLLVCFHPDIRSKVTITHPNNKQFFTERESKLTSGFPNKPEDQDTYEQLMKMEDKEIKFWTSVNEIPPFVNEIGMDWDRIVLEYETKQEILKQEYLKIEVDRFNKIIDDLEKDDVDKFLEDGDFPKGLLEFLNFDDETLEFISKEYKISIGTIYDIIDKDFTKPDVEDVLISD